jgi:hypothetical protein
LKKLLTESLATYRVPAVGVLTLIRLTPRRPFPMDTYTYASPIAC